MSVEMEEIIVYGSGSSGGFDWGTWEFDIGYTDYGQEAGDTGGGESANIEDVGYDSDLVELIFPNGLIVVIDKANMPEELINALLYLQAHYEEVSELKDFFDKLKDIGYERINLEMSPYPQRADGTFYESDDHDGPLTWEDLENAADTEGTAWANTSTQGGSVLITFNPDADWSQAGADLSWASYVIIHEFTHAIYPDMSETDVQTSAHALEDLMETNDPNLDLESGLTGYSDAERGLGNDNANFLTGGAGHDYLTGENGNDELYGKTGNDLLNGGSGDDKLFGAAGDDELIAGAGYDELYGGAGNDKYVIDVNMSGGIGDASGDGDYLDIQITSSVMFSSDGDALKITDYNSGEVLTVWNWFDGQEIETVSLANGTVLSADNINQIVAMQGGGGGLLPPIVFDLDGDGLELTDIDNGTKIDLDGDGKKDETGWVSADDGILVYDQNGNGKVDGVEEFTFNQFGEDAATDLEGLASFDDNGDGQITSEDAIWDSLLIWQDANQNGKSSPGELSTLDELGIMSINLTSTGELEVNAGNMVFGTSTYTMTDGTTGTIGDVALRANINGYEWQETSDLHNAIVDHFADL